MAHDAISDLKQDEPHSARIYDYFLGGQDNYEADRAAAAQIERAIPNVRMVARDNRAFMARAIAYLGCQGIRQFLDIGTGIPTEPNLHQVAQTSHADARVVYVDNDPIVLAHARALLKGTPEGRTCYLHGDVTEPDAILAAPPLREALDFDQPIAVSLVALCHFVPGERIYEIVDTLMAPLASGSYLVMTHLTTDFDPDTVEGTVSAYRASGIEMEARNRAGVARFFDDMTVIEPGIVAIEDWTSADSEPEQTDAVISLGRSAQRPPAAGYAVIGRKS